MELEFKHLVLIYAILLFLLFFFKPQLFNLNIQDKDLRKRKFLMLVALFIILAILSYYIKIYFELYM
jgi:hypothetical protein